MVAICPRCSQPNPTEARFCYQDGVPLTGRAAAPVDVASQPFATPFVFPSGTSCRNFDELARACELLWSEAVQVLQQGHLQRFFATLGRHDLALAVEQATRGPDPNRGLDQVLARLPSKVLAPPQLVVKPPSVHLGTLAPGQDGEFTLTLGNAGQRLIYGSLTSDCDWLAPGAEGADIRLIQFTHTLPVSIRVRGRRLRARGAEKPLEGQLIVETNAGTVFVRVTAVVPAQPFGEGILAGATTPRDLARKAKASPKEAALLFENGTVARWYQANGWTYPIQGPTASGLAAIQQFFEALGLTRPPTVELSQPQLQLRGAAGARLRDQLVVYTSEGRAVYAHGYSNEPWLTVLPQVCRGSVATLPVEVTVPARPGDQVQTTLRVVANGNQQFDVPVSVAATAAVPAPVPVAAAVIATVAPHHEPPVPPPINLVPPTPARTERPPNSPRPARRRYLLPLALLALALLGVLVADWVRDIPIQQADIQEDPAEKLAAYKVQVQDEPDEGTGGQQFKIEDEPEERTGKAVPVKVEIKDEPADGGGPPLPIDPTPWVKFALRAPGGVPPSLTDNRTGAHTGTLPNKGVPIPKCPIGFGISATSAAGAAKDKLLTWSANGKSNSTVVRIDGNMMELGDPQGRLVRAADLKLAPGVEPTPGGVSPVQTTWVVGGDNQGNGGLRFHQVLEVVPGQATTVDGKQRRLLDTVLIRWIIDNQDTKAHKVALRLQLDTLIGSNDGVPFTVPGQPGMVSTSADFSNPKDVPDFVQALEVPDLQKPGTIAHLTAKVGRQIEPPDRLSLTFQQFWGLGADILKNFAYPIADMKNDSAVILYWSDKDLAPGTKRVIGFAYGLGQIATSNDQLGLTLGGSFDPGQTFTATCYVEKPQPNQTLRLELPEGLSRVEGAETQNVVSGRIGASLVTWKVRVERTGTFRLTVHSSTGQTQAKTLTIARPDTGGKLALDLTGSFAPGQTFQVIGKVTEPVPGQTLTLQLPPGLQRLDGQDLEKVPAAVNKEATVRWQVRVLNAGKFPVRVVSSTGIVQTKTITIAQPGQSDANFHMSLKGGFAPGQVFSIRAEVTNPTPQQTLTLQLPAGLERVGGAEVQDVSGKSGSVGYWQVKVLQAGTFPVRVASSTGVIQRKNLVIEPPSKQPGQFTFELTGDIRPGKVISVVAHVPEPVGGQTLTLVLPKELKLVDGAERKPVPAGTEATVSWQVEVLAGGQLPVRVASSTGLTRTKTITLGQSGDSALFGR